MSDSTGGKNMVDEKAGSVTAIAPRAQAAPFAFSDEQRQMIRDTFASGAPEPEFQVFMEVARIRRLNPLTRQIHLVKRWNGDLDRMVWTPQTGIDGLRAIAERTGLYDGQDEPEFEYDGKNLKLAKVRVYKKGIARAFVGVAHFVEYAQYKKDRSLTTMWATKGHIMISKCAEALALRKAFPEDTSGVYTDEEMGHDPEAAGQQTVNVKPAVRVTPQTDENSEALCDEFRQAVAAAADKEAIHKITASISEAHKAHRINDLQQKALGDALRARLKDLMPAVTT